MYRDIYDLGEISAAYRRFSYENDRDFTILCHYIAGGAGGGAYCSRTRFIFSANS
jgi:hypothetical protein